MSEPPNAAVLASPEYQALLRAWAMVDWEDRRHVLQAIEQRGLAAALGLAPGRRIAVALSSGLCVGTVSHLDWDASYVTILMDDYAELHRFSLLYSIFMQLEGAGDAERIVPLPADFWTKPRAQPRAYAGADDDPFAGALVDAE